MSKSQTAVLRAPASSRRFLFALNFFKSPAMLGSLIPSSRFLVNDVLNQVDWDKARVIVEYGPGVGTITQEILKRMVAKADVLVENFRPGTLARWGLAYEDLAPLNAGLVMLSISAFGQTGPYSTRAGFGTLAEAMSGYAHITGQLDFSGLA